MIYADVVVEKVVVQRKSRSGCKKSGEITQQIRGQRPRTHEQVVVALRARVQQHATLKP